MARKHKLCQLCFVTFLTMIVTLNLRFLLQVDFGLNQEDDCERPIIVNVQSAVDAVNLNVSNAYLKWDVLDSAKVKMLGYKRPEKGFLTIGIPSIKRINGIEYVLGTIQSLSDHASARDKLQVTVIVFLADFDINYNNDAIKAITSKFTDLLDIGFLQIIQASSEFYPNFDNLKHNFNDAEARVRWRSKQVLDFSFMFMYAQPLSEYYLQIEDDVVCAANYIKSIRSYIKAQKNTWTLLEFSELGFIGKLFKAADLPKLSKFMLTFFEEQPVDWLLTYFRLASTQRDVLLRKPTLFQHVGLKSSFDTSSDNKLQDRYFDSGEKKWKADDPPGNVYSSMEHHLHWSAELSYASGSGYFWAKNSKKGDTLAVHFKEPQLIKRIIVETGSNKNDKDILSSGKLEVSPKFIKEIKDKYSNGTTVECSDWRTVGLARNGTIDTGELSSWSKPMECLKITQTENQENWIIFHQIAVFVYPK